MYIEVEDYITNKFVKERPSLEMSRIPIFSSLEPEIHQHPRARNSDAYLECVLSQSLQQQRREHRGGLAHLTVRVRLHQTRHAPEHLQKQGRLSTSRRGPQQ